jgi:hypothetical protein
MRPIPCLALLILAIPIGAKVDFNQEIRPILSDKCFTCHGPDSKSRKGELRLDRIEDALKAIVPGKPDESELIHRIFHDDPEERMPPVESLKKVSQKEAALLEQWILEGAEFPGHWAFQTIQKLPVPQGSGWTTNEIDNFIENRARAAGLQPSPPADSRTLLRRITLDLTGIPPSQAEYVAFQANPDLPATIDRLMASPRYGEHMAWGWLDAARYADSDGYESDPLRNMWPWRDWVVDAYNRHMPYDQFVVEQLAGDQLEEPTLRQKLATGFNRNHRQNNEGGIDPEEWIVEYVCDRAETTATVFMGLTWQCARCHDHKYDPVTMKDYYQLFDFFHQIPEVGNGRGASNAPPMMEVSSLDNLEELGDIQEKLAPLRKELESLEKSKCFEDAYQSWADGMEATKDAFKTLPGNLSKKEPTKWDAKTIAEARQHYLRNAYAPAKPILDKLQPLEKREATLKRTGSKVMVMGDMENRRKTHILEGGQFDKLGREVSADSPAFLPPMDKSLPKNRLGLAKWLVDPMHPLTARVAVNREWARFFGTGLVKTPEDFGSQGELPSHPELLDYLAFSFIEISWDIQALQKKILLSSTYRQTSKVRPGDLEKDPDNRLLSRGSRYRLPAPVIRDQALAASGLLVEKVGGPPVKPYQPAGLWKEIIKGQVVYKRDTGEKLYRRSLYTLWRRAVKPPLMTLLDANGRDTCAVDLKRTNTPLQALLLLNDETFVEHARGLATRILRKDPKTDEAKARAALQIVLGRDPHPGEIPILTQELRNQRQHFQQNPEDTKSFLTIGDSIPDPGLDPADLAATTCLARVLLNLDETLSKE